MVLANCSPASLVSAALGPLVLPYLRNYRVLAADFEQVIVTVLTLKYLNPAAYCIVVTLFA